MYFFIGIFYHNLVLVRRGAWLGLSFSRTLVRPAEANFARISRLAVERTVSMGSPTYTPLEGQTLATRAYRSNLSI